MQDGNSRLSTPTLYSGKASSPIRVLGPTCRFLLSSSCLRLACDA